MLIAFGMIGWGERVVCKYSSSLSYTQYELNLNLLNLHCLVLQTIINFNCIMV
jgi:hypothetical protein